MMKKTFYFLTFVLAITLQSCGEKAVPVEKVVEKYGQRLLLANNICYSIFQGEATAKFPYDAQSLVVLELPTKIKYEGEVYPVTSVGRQAFMGSPNLTTIQMPNSITKLGATAFAGCPKLTSITFSDSLKTIAPQAFHRCTGLTSVVIPEGIEVIDQEAFSYCSNLTNVTLPISVKELGISAFAFCQSLETLEIPNPDIKVGWRALAGCSLFNLTVAGQPYDPSYFD